MSQNDLLKKLELIEKSLQEKKVEILNVKEAAELIKLSTHQIYRLTSRREIPHYKVNGKLVFEKYMLLKWVLNSDNRVKTKHELLEEIESD